MKSETDSVVDMEDTAGSVGLEVLGVRLGTVRSATPAALGLSVQGVVVVSLLYELQHVPFVE